MSKIGLLGGTFDPIHLGHLRAAEEVREALGLEKILFIPAGLPPHKHRPDLSPFPLRFEMVRLAIQEIPYFEVTALEGKRKGPSYTVITLKELKARFPEQEFFFILGLDAFLEIQTWYHYQELPLLAHLVIITRGRGGREEFDQKLKTSYPQAQKKGEVYFYPQGFSLRFLPVTRLDISATMIRERVRQGASIRFLVPEEIRRFIDSKGLYRPCSSPKAR